jgi:pimeloyl-ACP methyl ester carboxylesterase
VTGHARRIIKTIAASLFVLLLAGVTYQGIATALERRSFRYPGRLVPVGDHQLHMHCIGTGRPVVVLEAPAMGFSASWQLVQASLEATTRVCAYDRAGLGWSEASDRPYDAATAPSELHTLLAGAGEPAPYVLVGEGLGAVLAMEFARRYADDTAALVVNDWAGADGGGARRAGPSPWLARTGILRLSRVFASDRALLPGPDAGAVRAFGLRPDHLTRGAQESRQVARFVSQTTAPVPATIPLHRLGGEATLLRTTDGARQIERLIADVVADWRRVHE